LMDRPVVSKMCMLIVGDRPSAYSTLLHSKVKTLSVEKQSAIRILPHCSNAEDYFLASDIMISTAKIEAFPKVIQEAMFFGLPMVVAPVFGVQEQVTDEVSALYFPAGDSNKLAEQLTRLIRSSELRQHLGFNAKQSLGRFPSASDMTKEYYKIICEAWLTKDNDIYQTRGYIKNHSPTLETYFIKNNVEQGEEYKMDVNHNFIRTIHSKDYMYDFLLSNNNGNLKIAEGKYFGGGQHDAKMLLESAERINLKIANSKILEFASGYGRVTRHLAGISNNYIASDIHPEAVKFLRSELDTNGILSSTFPEKFDCKFSFDFIFVFSLFSHLPQDSFFKWLSTLYNQLDTGGHLLFTTHGEYATTVSDFLMDIYNPEIGYGFKPDSEQKDLDGSSYGTTVTGREFVADAIEKYTGANIVSAKCTRAWDAIERSHDTVCILAEVT